MKNSEKAYGNYWTTVKRNTVCPIEILVREDKDEMTESIVKALTAEKFLILGREMEIQMHEA